MRPLRIHLIPNDWPHLEQQLNYLTKWVASQPITELSSPVFAGLTLTGLSGVLKATAGVISGSATFDNIGNGSSTTMRTNLNTDLLDGNHASAFQVAGDYQPLDATLTALAGLDVTAGLLKQTAADTFVKITDNSSNWNTAYGWGDHSTGGYFKIVLHTLDDITDGAVYKKSHNDFTDTYKNYLNQSVQTGASPTFNALIITTSITFASGGQICSEE